MVNIVVEAYCSPDQLLKKPPEKEAELQATERLVLQIKSKKDLGSVRRMILTCTKLRMN